MAITLSILVEKIVGHVLDVDSGGEDSRGCISVDSGGEDSRGCISVDSGGEDSRGCIRCLVVVTVVEAARVVVVVRGVAFTWTRGVHVQTLLQPVVVQPGLTVGAPLPPTRGFVFELWPGTLQAYMQSWWQGDGGGDSSSNSSGGCSGGDNMVVVVVLNLSLLK